MTWKKEQNGPCDQKSEEKLKKKGYGWVPLNRRGHICVYDSNASTTKKEVIWIHGGVFGYSNFQSDLLRIEIDIEVISEKFFFVIFVSNFQEC